MISKSILRVVKPWHIRMMDLSTTTLLSRKHARAYGDSVRAFSAFGDVVTFDTT